MIAVSARASILAKAISIILAIWLLNILFVAVHEIGHAAIAICFGANICHMYISPFGYDGATSYTIITDIFKNNIVIAGGVLATILATLITQKMKIELAVYVLGLRTIESLSNFTKGSDMALLLRIAGPWTLVISLTLIGIIVICLGHTLYKRLDKSGQNYANQLLYQEIPAIVEIESEIKIRGESHSPELN